MLLLCYEYDYAQSLKYKPGRKNWTHFEPYILQYFTVTALKPLRLTIELKRVFWHKL